MSRIWGSSAKARVAHAVTGSHSLSLLRPSCCLPRALPALPFLEGPRCLQTTAVEQGPGSPWSLDSIQQNGAGLFLQYFYFAKGGAQGGLGAMTSGS